MDSTHAFRSETYEVGEYEISIYIGYTPMIRIRKKDEWRRKSLTDALDACRAGNVSLHTKVLFERIPGMRWGDYNTQKSLELFSELGTTVEEVREFCRLTKIKEAKRLVKEIRKESAEEHMLYAGHLQSDLHHLNSEIPDFYGPDPSILIGLADIGLT